MLMSKIIEHDMKNYIYFFGHAYCHLDKGLGYLFNYDKLQVGFIA